jgi:hypothetical protein
MEGQEAIENYREVGNTLQELVNVYNQVINSCNPNNNFVGFSEIYTGEIDVFGRKVTRDANFREQLEIIRIFLKAISSGSDWEDEFTDEEMNIFNNVVIFGGLSWFSIEYIMNEMIDWLNDALTNCERGG